MHPVFHLYAFVLSVCLSLIAEKQERERVRYWLVFLLFLLQEKIKKNQLSLEGYQGTITSYTKE